MKKYWVWAILVSMSLFLAGCEDDDDNSSPGETAAAATMEDNGNGSDDESTAGSDAGVANSNASDEDAASPAPAVEAEAEASFAGIVPSGLKVSESYSIAGRGTMYVLVCDAIDGATSYTFFTSFGSGSTGPSPRGQFLRTGIDNDFSFTVSAKNADGVQTQTATKSVDVP